MVAVHVDLETRSRVDIESCGVPKYARHESTEVLCARYSVGDGPVEQWLPGDPVPEPFSDPDAVYWAHNAAFESQIVRHVMAKRHGWPVIPNRRWRCTAAMSAYRNLPRGLGKVSERLEFGDAEKDKDGRANMLKLCRPFGKDARLVNGVWEGGEFNEEPERHERNYTYCGQDVVAERTIPKRLPPLSDRMQRLYLLDRKINERGIPVDRKLCEGAVEILHTAHERGCLRLAQLTDGAIDSPGQTKRIKALADSLGYDLPNCQAETLDEILDPTAPDCPPDPLYDVLLIRSQLAAASVKKFAAVNAIANADDRCRDQIVFYGASTTGRFSGAGIQPHNLKRTKGVSDELIEAIQSGDYDAVQAVWHGNVIDALAASVRSIVCAPAGRTLVHSDFSAVEARKLAWLAGEEYLLDLFRSGACVYSGMAAKIYSKGEDWARWVAENYETDKEAKHFRQVGKVAVLGLGYQCGAAKFVGMAKSMAGLTLDLSFAENVVEMYRNNNPNIRNLWRNLERAALTCVKHKRRIRVGKVRFSLIEDWMTIELPSGRSLYYHRPYIDAGKFGSPQVYYHSATGRKVGLYGGIICENITQASSADLLYDALFRLDRARLYTVLHVHDSAGVECREGDAETPKKVHRLMEQLEPWAKGFPMKAGTEVSRRMP